MLAELETELAEAPRAEVALAALEHGALVLVEGEQRAAEAVDRLAPEHLQVVTEDPRAFLARVRSFGAAFLGPFTPVTLGDYGVGSNHVLPTMGTARFASGLRAADLVTVSYVLEAAREGIERVGSEVEAIAKAEGFFGHARASEIRRSG